MHADWGSILSSEGFQQCYNAQMAVDGEHQIIVATEVGPQASDQGQLVGMLDEINETFGVEPAVVLADAGYCNEPDLLELEDRGIDAHVALGREGKSQVAVDPARLPATHRMGEKLARPAGKARYAQRKWLSEAPNGWIKEVLGFRRFSLRGLAKVRGEWDLVCLALNIKRMGTVATCETPTDEAGAGLPTHLLRGAQCPSTAYETRISSVPAFRSGISIPEPGGPDVHTRAKIPPLRRPRANRPASKLLRRTLLGRLSKCDLDPEVAAFVRERLGTMPVIKIAAEVLARFGPDRAPRKTAICRYWQRLDEERCAT